jgi:hypothetical protein
MRLGLPPRERSLDREEDDVGGPSSPVAGRRSPGRARTSHSSIHSTVSGTRAPCSFHSCVMPTFTASAPTRCRFGSSCGRAIPIVSNCHGRSSWYRPMRPGFAMSALAEDVNERRRDERRAAIEEPPPRGGGRGGGGRRGRRRRGGDRERAERATQRPEHVALSERGAL